ncbi:chlorohydrolase [Streptococcus pneumoniae]|nr:chlorohydrolase [Streptococcus pneumoniae]
MKIKETTRKASRRAQNTVLRLQMKDSFEVVDRTDEVAQNTVLRLQMKVKPPF